MAVSFFNNYTLPPRAEWLRALGWTALIMTLPVALALVGSFADYADAAAHGHPWLRWIPVCGGCAFCGMTRAFCALSAGNFDAAWRWNRGGIFLYAASWLWLLVVAVFVTRRALQAGRQSIRFGRFGAA